MCIFCKILNGEIPSYKIYEDEYTYAFLDVNDDVVGHTLVIPKEHYDNVLDIPEKILNKVMSTVKKISQHYVENHGFTGVNIFNNSGVDAEQSVMHLHIHILPRKNDDGVKVFNFMEKRGLDLNKLCEELKIN